MISTYFVLIFESIRDKTTERVFFMCFIKKFYYFYIHCWLYKNSWGIPNTIGYKQLCGFLKIYLTAYFIAYMWQMVVYQKQCQRESEFNTANLAEWKKDDKSSPPTWSILYFNLPMMQFYDFISDTKAKSIVFGLMSRRI